LGPGDAAIAAFGGNLTDDVLRNHIFEGNLTGDVLLLRSQIVAVNGETFTVEHQVVSNRRNRRQVLITIANNRSRTVLTVLDVPSGAGVVHGIDSVLERDNGAPASGDGSSGSSSGQNSLGAAEWSLIVVAILLVALLLAVVVLIQRSRRNTSEPVVVDHYSHRNSWGPGMSGFNPMAADITDFNNGVDARTPQSARHYYPPDVVGDPTEVEHGAGQGNVRHEGQSVPAGSMKSSVSKYVTDYERFVQSVGDDRSGPPGHYYPDHAPALPDVRIRNMGGQPRGDKRRGKLNTPMHPNMYATRSQAPSSHGPSGGYLDPDPT